MLNDNQHLIIGVAQRMLPVQHCIKMQIITILHRVFERHLGGVGPWIIGIRAHRGFPCALRHRLALRCGCNRC